MTNMNAGQRAAAWGRKLVLPVLLIAAWQFWASTLPTGSPAPAPLKVLQTLGDLLSTGSLLSATVQSLGRVVLGFAMASVLGIALGLMMGASQAVRENLDPIIESFRPIAPMAILPIAILWLGTGTPTALAIVAYASFFPVVVNTVHGVSHVDRKLILAARTMGISPWTILVRVVLPGALPSIFQANPLSRKVEVQDSPQISAASFEPTGFSTALWRDFMRGMWQRQGGN